MVGDIKRTYTVKTFLSLKTQGNSERNKLSGLFSQKLQAGGHDESRWLKHVTLHPLHKKHVPDTGRL